MMRTPPSVRRRRGSPLLNPTKRSRVLSETSEIEICEDNDDVIPSGSQKLEKNVNKDGVNDTTNETTDTPHLSGYVSDGDDKESTPASQKTSKNTTKKSKGRPKENVTQKMLLEALHDQESNIMKALISALVTPIREAIKEEMKIQEKNFDMLNKQISALQTDLNEKNRYISTLEERIDDLEQYSRRNCLVITGIPEKEDEKTDEIILDIAKKQLNVDLQPTDIDRSHRIPGGPIRRGNEKSRNIVVKFSTYNARRRVIEQKSRLKSMNNRIFINEQLTKKRSELYYEARKLVKARKVKQAWTYDGRVLVRNNDDKVQPIKNLIDIASFTNTPPGWSPVLH